MKRPQFLLTNAICAFGLLSLARPTADAQQPPQATELPGSPWSIKQTWMIGGMGPWDYLAMDATAGRLFIAHGSQVQVVDVKTGTPVGQVTGLRDAHDIALDASGEFGYISDGLANDVKVFDRRTFQVVASIPTGSTPRALVLEPQTGLLFAICTNPMIEPQLVASDRGTAGAGRASPSSQLSRAALQANSSRSIKTTISVIDVQARRRIGEVLMPGKLGFAQANDQGQLFVLLVNRNQVARVDAQAIADALHRSSNASLKPRAPNTSIGAESAPVSDGGSSTGSNASSTKDKDFSPPILDWSNEQGSRDQGQGSMRLFALGSACPEPRSLAVDGHHQRIFAACNNMKLAVVNTGTGEIVTSLPIGPGTDSVGYDASRGLIYTANGGAQGTLTVIRQDVTDTYAEIENLPTRQRARTLAINSENGQIYLVTDYMGVNLAKQGGIGTLKSVPVEGSFQVLVVGQ